MRTSDGAVLWTTLDAELLDMGWTLLDHGTHKSTFYRWSDGNRIELLLCYDQSQRLYCWSEWHNTRVISPDHEKGRRQRLVDHARRSLQ